MTRTYFSFFHFYQHRNQSTNGLKIHGCCKAKVSIFTCKLQINWCISNKSVRIILQNQELFPSYKAIFMKTTTPRALKFSALIGHIVVFRHVEFHLDSMTSSKNHSQRLLLKDLNVAGGGREGMLSSLVENTNLYSVQKIGNPLTQTSKKKSSLLLCSFTWALSKWTALDNIGKLNQHMILYVKLWVITDSRVLSIHCTCRQSTC